MEERMRRGFTLLELLVVISVIAMLAGLLFPVLAQARLQAHQTVCLANTGQLTRAYLLYVQDWDERLPEWYLPGPPRPQPFGARRFWPEPLQPYLRDVSVLRDPSALWEPQEDVRLADYTLTTSEPGGSGTQADPYWRWPGPPLSLGMVWRPAETVFLSEGWTTTGWRLGPLARHRRGLNVGFIDGHARWLLIQELNAVATDGAGRFWFRFAAADR
jgi:prepilin-type N-terminal cleavage/methylation domain-containing protein/prepilin-type processing-associated H-X9-DG protein